MELFLRTILRSIVMFQIGIQCCFADYEFMNCEFQTSGLQRKYLAKNQKDMYDVQFGTEPLPFKLKNVTYNSRMDIFSYDIPKFISKNDYNTMDPMLAFFHEFNKSSSIGNNYTTFESFFDKFIPKMEKQGSLKQIMDLKQYLVPKFTSGTRNAFLVTVWHNVETEIVEDIKNLTKIPDYFYHAYIAIVFRVNLHGINKYLYFDTEIGLVNVLEANENEKNKDLPFGMLEDSQMKYMIRRGKKRHDLIYVAPFCSFITTTAKVRLLNKEQRIIRRNMKGDVWASLTIDLLPADGRSYFTFVIHGRGGEKQQPLLGELDSFIKVNFFHKIAELFNNMNSNTLMNILNDYKKIILHESFLTLYQELLRNRPLTGPSMNVFSISEEGKKFRCGHKKCSKRQSAKNISESVDQTKSNASVVQEPVKNVKKRKQRNPTSEEQRQYERKNRPT